MNRPYDRTGRAAEAERTAQRILEAALTRFQQYEFEQVTLDAIAADAAVTVQTVLRRFGSKEGLVRALAQVVTPQVEAQRGAAPVGDIRGAIGNLVEHYETEGDLAMHLLRQERRVPAIAEITTVGKQVHLDWTTRVFAPWLDSRTGAARERLTAQVVAVCDAYTWFLLRRQRGLSRDQTQLAIVELLEGLLQ
jgi:AcrR family transcriptional regulator